MPDRAFIMSPSPRLAVLVLLASSCHGILALDKVSLPRGAPLRPALGSAVSGSRVPRGPVLSAATASALPPSGGASMPSTIANLAKNIVGSGVLALAAGVGAFSGARVAIVPALALLFMMCGLSGYTFSSIARVSAAVGASSYRDAWSKVFGQRSAAFPNAAIVFKTFVGCLAYAIILGDSAASMASLAGGTGALAAPNLWIGLISTCILLPLCLLRDLSSLSVGSIIGTLGTSYTAIFMAIRCLDGSYAAGGARAALIPASARPAFSAPVGVLGGLNLKSLVLVSMLATTFLAHYNAPKFYTELAAPKKGMWGGKGAGGIGGRERVEASSWHIATRQSFYTELVAREEGVCSRVTSCGG